MGNQNWLYKVNKTVTGSVIIPVTESNVVGNASESDWDTLLYVQYKQGYISSDTYFRCKRYTRWKYGVILPAETVVYNANRTTGDNLIYNGEDLSGTVIEIWREFVDDALKTEQRRDSYFWSLVEPKDAETCPNKYCEGNDPSQICGAHVVLTKPEESQPPRIGELVFIIPLCQSCNHYSNQDPIVLDRDVPALTISWT